MEKFDELEGTKLREAINKHIAAMLRQAIQAMENTAYIQVLVEGRTPWLREKDEAAAVATPTVMEILEMEYGKKLQKYFNILLAEDYKLPIKNGLPGLRAHLFVGMRYYEKALKKETFTILNDLPRLLTIDERMSTIFAEIKGLLFAANNITLTMMRTQRSKDAVAKRPIESKKKILKTIANLKKQEEKKNKARTINGWALEINRHHSEPISTEKVRSFIKEEYGQNITKPPRAKYLFVELFHKT